MSSRRRRFESSWDTKEETTLPAGISEKNPLQGKELQSSSREGSSPKWSNLEANDAVMPDDFSGRQSWEPLQGNGSMPKDDDINRDRHMMQTDRTFNEWENQYSTRPSNDSYGPPYRGRDRGIGGNEIMSRDRDRSRSRSWSPKRSRSRSRGRGNSRGMSRSRSRDRDRGRPRESARARSRSPFYDHGREPYEHTDTRNDSRVSSRPKCKDFAAGNCRRGSQCRFFHQESLNSRDDRNRMNNDLPEKRSNRPEYSGCSRYSDDRNSADRPRNRAPDGYKNDDFHRGDRNLYDDQDRRRQSNRNSRVPCRFFAAGKCNRNDCKFSHDAPESGAYQGRPHDNSRGQNLGDKNRTWNDRQPWDDLNETGFSEFTKSNNNIGEKNKSSNGTSWDDVESAGFGERSRDDIHGRSLDDRNRTWNGSMSRSRHNSDDKKKVWDGPLWDEVDASGFSDIGKSSHHFDDNNKPMNGPSWDHGTSASGFSNIPKPRHNSDDNKKSRNGSSRDTVKSSGAKLNNNIDGKRKSWSGPSWDEVSESGYSNNEKFNGLDGNSTKMFQTDDKSRKRDAPGWNEKIFEKNDDFLSQKTSIANYTDIASNETRTINHQEPRFIPDGSLSHTLDSHGYVMPQASGSQFTNATTATKVELPGVSGLQQQQVQEDDDVVMEIDDSDVHNVDMASKDSNQHILTSGNETIRSFDNMDFQLRPNITEQSQQTHPSIPFNGPKIQPNGSAQGVFLSLDSHIQAQYQNNKDPKPQEAMERSQMSEQVPQVSGLRESLPEISQKGQLPQPYIDLNLANAIELLYSLPSSASSGLPIDPMAIQHNLDTRPKEQCDSTIRMEASEPVKTSLPMGILSGSVGPENQMPVKRSSPISTGVPHSSKVGAIGVPVEERGKSPKSKKEELVRNPEGHENKAKNTKKERENINTDNSEAKGKEEEGNNSNDEKAMRLFKAALVEFVKDILKPTWKEGKMSREVHKTIVKKVVDKVSSAIQGTQIPRTQEKITHYLDFSKSKITKLVEAYVERNLKA